MKVPPKSLRVIIAGGGTGGHLFPGISIAERLLTERRCDIRFVGTRRGLESSVIPQAGFKLYTLPISGLYRVGLKKKIVTLLKLPLALTKSLFILIWFRPHLVIGIGGYASGPILVLSLLLRKRTVIQEQNAYPGLTNRLLGRYVNLAFIPFEKAASLFKNPVVVGNPIRETIRVAAERNEPRGNARFTLTILGGSQGAHIINQTLVKSLESLAHYSDRLSIIHQTGQRDWQWIRSEYEKYPKIETDIRPFFDDVASVFQRSDLLICRAGSMINEIIAMGRASILVPIAVSSGNHQLENARTMAAANAAVVIEESDLTVEGLSAVLDSLINSPEKISEMERNSKSLYTGDSVGKIVDEITRFYDL